MRLLGPRSDSLALDEGGCRNITVNRSIISVTTPQKIEALERPCEALRRHGSSSEIARPRRRAGDTMDDPCAV